MAQTTPPLIFESPDGGKTVYARQSGSTDRWIHQYNEKTQAMLKTLAEEKLWDEIRDAAEENSTLANLLEQVKATYALIKK
jgi:hypothetical protein